MMNVVPSLGTMIFVLNCILNAEPVVDEGGGENVRELMSVCCDARGSYPPIDFLAA